MKYSSGLQENLFDNASVISKLLFLWPWKIVKLGAEKILNQSDLPPVSPFDSSENLCNILTTLWMSNSSLFRSLCSAFGPKFLKISSIICFESALKIFQAKMLGNLVDYFSNTNSDDTIWGNGYFLSGIISTCGILVGLMHHQYFFYANRIGMQCKIALSAMIFDKAIMLDMQEFSHLASGHIVNLCSQDVESFIATGIFLVLSVTPLFEALAVLVVGYLEVGYSFLAGFAIIIMLIPMQWWFSKLIAKIRFNTVSRTDKRVKLCNQALVGARLMKINAWEDTFRDIIGGARDMELQSYWNSASLKAINEVLNILHMIFM